MSDDHNKQRERKIYQITLVGGIVNLLLMLFKFFAGIAGRSSAMIADAVHSLSDFATDIVVLVFVRISGKPKDKNHKYGHGKFETLATLIIGFILLLVGGGIAWDGISNIMQVLKGEVLPSPGVLALVAALVSILMKEALYWYTVIVGKKVNSMAVVANAWHHRSDALSSIAAAVGIGGALLLGEKWTILDPLAALVVSLFIILVALRLMKPCLDELMEKSLPEKVEQEIVSIVNTFEQVGDLHNLRTRKIGNTYAIEFHIRMDGTLPLQEAHQIITDIEMKLRNYYGADTHVVVHLEPYKES
ncbi:MAG: cation diffusion facilitator family transporter [Bacteroidales bacterium]|nr:cation diffusion facilitator family transporter [Bacteroidales bacterium]MCL2132790.1 cation diffusion facilitator family transporter [Bacteroidales bacterium]